MGDVVSPRGDFPAAGGVVLSDEGKAEGAEAASLRFSRNVGAQQCGSSVVAEAERAFGQGCWVGVEDAFGDLCAGDFLQQSSGTFVTNSEPCICFVGKKT